MLPGSREERIRDLSGRQSTFFERVLSTDPNGLYFASPFWDQIGTVDVTKSESVV